MCNNIIDKRYKMKRTALTLLILVATILTVQTSQQQYFPLKMHKNFDLGSPCLTFSYSDSTDKESKYLVRLGDRKTSEYKSKYFFTDQKLLMAFTSSNQKLTVLSTPNSLVIWGFNSNEDVIVDKNSKFRTFKNFKQIKVETSLDHHGGVSLEGNFDMLVIGVDSDISQTWWEASIAKTRHEAQKKLKIWMSIFSVAQEQEQFAQEMLSQTLSMICKEDQHIGLCDLAHLGTRHEQYQIDIRHSFLILDLLYPSFPHLSLSLFQQMINILEDRLFYEKGKLPFVPIPEHIAVFKNYYQVVKNKQEKQRLSGFSIRVKAVLNGLINQLLLSDVNNLEEEKNYRESRNLHPTLYKMLNMQWKSTSAKQSVSSIYEESFTPDFFYNYPHEKTFLCMSKIGWLAYATTEFNRLINEIGDYFDIAALEQPLSLLKVLRHFSNSDAEAIEGKYYSVNILSGGVKMYNRQGGYQSVLPFLYGITDFFPEMMFRNITTKYGLASLHQNHPKKSTKYEYRTNIHSYFNYKILFESKEKLLKGDKKYHKFVKVIDYTLANIRHWMKQQWREGKSFTMWTTDGKGVRNKKQLSLVNAALMGEK